MADKYLGIEKYIFSDVYNLFLKYRNVHAEDEILWGNCTNDANLLIVKYKEHPLAKNMVLNVLEQLNHKATGLPLNGYTHEQWEVILKDVHK